jgi:hypothetical protein
MDWSDHQSSNWYKIGINPRFQLSAMVLAPEAAICLPRICMGYKFPSDFHCRRMGLIFAENVLWASHIGFKSLKFSFWRVCNLCKDTLSFSALTWSSSQSFSDFPWAFMKPSTFSFIDWSSSSDRPGFWGKRLSYGISTSWGWLYVTLTSSFWNKSWKVFLIFDSAPWMRLLYNWAFLQFWVWKGHSTWGYEVG